MKTLNILLVDDNNNFRRAFKMLLEKQYHASIIGEASNAKDFLTLNLLSNADIIFMDIMMPEVDGISLARQCLSYNNKIKIIAITMYSEMVYQDSLIESGFVGCIFKNELFTELSIALETVLNNNKYFPKRILTNRMEE
jgi:DNA-binding NarL/FixJ family response regulator